MQLHNLTSDEEQPRHGGGSKAESPDSSHGQPRAGAFNPAPDLEISSDGMSASEAGAALEEAKAPIEHGAAGQGGWMQADRFSGEDEEAAIPQTAEKGKAMNAYDMGSNTGLHPPT